MKLKAIKVVQIFLGGLMLSGCHFQFFAPPKGMKDKATNIEPTLYTLEEQKDVLKPYIEFYELSYLDKEYTKNEGTYIIPGLLHTETLELNKFGFPSESFSMDPQGVAVTRNYILISAYSHDLKHNSVIYVLDKNNHKYIKTVVLQGKPHVGGITFDVKSNSIWVCSESINGKAQIVSISLEELEKYNINQSYKPIDYQQIVNLKGIKKASYLTYYDNSLFVGYFSKKNEAIIEKYKLTENGRFIEEIKQRTTLTSKNVNATPDDIDKVTHGIQGITIYKDYLLLSQSYGPKNSKILIYSDINKEKIFMEKDSIKEIEAPPYLEQITIDNKQIYTIFESATKRFRKDLNVTRVDRVLKLDLNSIKEIKNRS